MNEIVLDASALLALLNEEPGADVVTAALPQAIISAVNLAEVVAKLNEAGMPEQAIREALDELGLEVAAFEKDSAYKSGLLRLATKALGLSLGDRACLALGLKLGLPVLTADRTWKNLNVGVQVQVIRNSEHTEQKSDSTNDQTTNKPTA